MMTEVSAGGMGDDRRGNSSVHADSAEADDERLEAPLLPPRTGTVSLRFDPSSCLVCSHTYRIFQSHEDAHELLERHDRSRLSRSPSRFQTSRTLGSLLTLLAVVAQVDVAYR